ncbi:FAD/NAD(P)-binding domain-containing protein [Auriculariales sp. MPI-PUGE-AT-0066]|nr:FAD/NAD(P)-binding domain-containing protein [Auriculariales sp. MPI-PUGE-AT-0066]
MVKNVIVLGGAYGGGRAARLLAQGLPKTHRVVIVDKNDHFNHLYLFPRYGVVPGHADKAFIPDLDFFNGPLFAQTGAVSGQSADDSFPVNAPIIVHATATKITHGFIEVDEDVTANNTTVCLADLAEGRAGASSHTDAMRKSLTVQPRSAKDVLARRRIPYDYLVYATGCEMPRALAMDGRTKEKGVNYLNVQCETIARAKNILVAGAGALGIQYATDIAELYNNPAYASIRPAGPSKNITIVHSRPRFLPIYKTAMHDAILKRMDDLGVNVVLDDRVEVPSEDILRKMEANSRRRYTHTVRTRKGKEIEADLVLVCTGQKPNSQLLRKFAPDSLDEWGFVRTEKTMRAHELPKVFAVGDVAEAGAVKAGHTAWNMGTIAADNIIALVKGADEKELQHYTPTPPMIKVTLGMQHGVAETLKAGVAETVVVESEDGLVEGHWEIIWRSRGADPTDPSR